MYSQEQCTFNLHQLVHLPLSVERWGPLWATSAFRFENNNGLLLELIHGTQQISMQIVNTFKYINGLCVFASKVDHSYLVSPINVDSFTGKPLKIKPILLLIEKLKLSEYFSCDIDNLKYFSKCTIRNTVFTSLNYVKSAKRNNCTFMYKVLVEMEYITVIGFIKYYVKYENCDNRSEIVCVIERHDSEKSCFRNKECNIKTNHIIPKDPLSSCIDIIPVTNDVKKLIFLNKELVAYSPNIFESNL